MSKKQSKQDNIDLTKSVGVKKEFKKPKITKPASNLSPQASTSSSLSSSAKPKAGSYVVIGKLPSFLAKSKEKKEPSVLIGSKVIPTQVDEPTKRSQLSSEGSSMSRPKLPIGKIVYPQSANLTKKEATPVKTIKLGPKSLSKIEEKSSSSDESEKLKKISHKKVGLTRLIN
jgi:hypothetical protein